MREKIRILVLTSNPWTSSRILGDEEAREIFEGLREGLYRDRFELHNHAATKASDLQKLLLMYEPHIVHFSGHASQTDSRATQRGLANLFALYNTHVRLVLLNACFTKAQARSISEVINYSIVTGIGDKVGVTFAGVFYRALGFGKSIRMAFESAKAELDLTTIPRSRGIELFVRNGVSERDRFPRMARPARRRGPLTQLYRHRLSRTVSRRLRRATR